MSLKLFSLVIFLAVEVVSSEEESSFIYNGFQSSHLYVDDSAEITSNGLLQLTNGNTQAEGHAFHPNPIVLKNTFNGTLSSFSTTFVFAIRSQYPTVSGHGFAFVVSPSRGFSNSQPTQYLGILNPTNNGNNTNHVFAVEADTVLNGELNDINDNHVGIDINDLKSVQSAPAGYYSDQGKFQNLTLISGYPMQIWVEYDGVNKHIDVTLAPINIAKPQKPLLSLSKDLSPYLNNRMYVGFSSSTGSFHTYHYILGWSFKVNGQAQEIVISQLPKLPKLGDKDESKFLTIGLPLISLSLVFMITLLAMYVIKRKRKFSELLEDWELEYGHHRFKFKDLYFATNGFKEKELLGSGGFGRVYKGVMLNSKSEVAVKRVCHESKQGMREFVSEIVSLGRLRHRNLVPLRGYCRRKGELLLVYDYMPNGSLDKYLYNQPRVTLNWDQRFTIIKGVASGLLYLHEEWEQVVVHRDIKASNVLLDREMNGRLGDFGLARLYDHGTDPQTTHVVGTLGYLAPELARTGKVTRSSDVYAFGAFLLEVACGRRPIEYIGEHESVILVYWVCNCWKRGEILEAKDPYLGIDYKSEEVELVLKLGLLCSHSEPSSRPNMRQVVQYLESDVPLPDLSSLSLFSTGLTFGQHENFHDFSLSYSSSTNMPFSDTTDQTSTSVAESLLFSSG